MTNVDYLCHDHRVSAKYLFYPTKKKDNYIVTDINRSGCPSDWIWIVPPMSSSITPVFHQEMALYYLKPSYEYQVSCVIKQYICNFSKLIKVLTQTICNQEPAWKTHQWQKSKPITGKRPINRKFHFKQIARAVKFTSKLFGRALSKRIKATVLYATETGKSEQFAKELGVIFGHAFNAQVCNL